jgi:serine/threonine protein kinase
MVQETRVGSEFAGYRIEGVIGRGGMSVVYLAEHVRLGRKVALKVLAPDLAESERCHDRFLRESKLAASIDHPNIVPIYDADEAEGVLYVAMH